MTMLDDNPIGQFIDDSAGARGQTAARHAALFQPQENTDDDNPIGQFIDNSPGQFSRDIRPIIEHQAAGDALDSIHRGEATGKVYNDNEKGAVLDAHRMKYGLASGQEQQRQSDERMRNDSTKDNSALQNFSGAAARTLAQPGLALEAVVAPETAAREAENVEAGYAPPRQGSAGAVAGNLTGLALDAAPLIANPTAAPAIMAAQGFGGARLDAQQQRNAGNTVTAAQEFTDAGLQALVQFAAGNVLQKVGGSKAVPFQSIISKLPAPVIKQIIGTGGKELTPMISQMLIKAGVGAGDNEIAGVLSNVVTVATQVDKQRGLLDGSVDNLLSGALLAGGMHVKETMGGHKTTVTDNVALQRAQEGVRQAGVPDAKVNAAAAKIVEAYKSGDGSVKVDDIVSQYTSASTDGEPVSGEKQPVTWPQVTGENPNSQATKLPDKVTQQSEPTLDEAVAERGRLADQAKQMADRMPPATDIGHPEGRIEEAEPPTPGEAPVEYARPEGTKLPLKVQQAAAPEPADPSDKTAAALPDFIKAASDAWGRGKTLDVELHKPESAAEQAADLIAESTGRKLALFTSAGSDEVAGGVHPRHPDVIFVRRGSKRPILDIVGHELLHSIKRVEGQQAYDTLLSVIKGKAGAQHEEGVKQYKEMSAGSKTGERVAGDAGLAEEEGAAMVFGRMFTSRDFHAEMSMAHPALYQKIKDYVVKFVTDLKNKITKRYDRLTAPPEVQRELARELQGILEATRSGGEAPTETKAEKLPGRVLKTEVTKPVSEAEKIGEKTPQKVALASKSNDYFSHAVKNNEFHPEMVKEMGGDSREQVEAYRQSLVADAVGGDESAQAKLATTMLPAIKDIARRVLGPRAKGGMDDAVSTGLAEVQRFIAGSETRQQPGEDADAYGQRKGKSPLAGWSKAKGDVYSLLFNSLKSSLTRHLEDTYGHNITQSGEGAKETHFPTSREGNQSLDKAEQGSAHTDLREDERSRGDLPKTFADLPSASRDNLVKTLSERFNASLEKGDSEEGVRVKFAGKGQEGAPSDNPDRVHGWRSPSGKKLVAYRDSVGWHYADYGGWAEGDPSWQAVKASDPSHAKFEEAWKGGKMTAPITDVAEVLNSKFDAGRVDAVYLPKAIGDDGSIEFERHPVEERADANWIGRTLKNNLVDITEGASKGAEALKAMKDDLDAIFRPAIRSETAGKAAGIIREKGSDLAMKRERAITALSETRKMFKKMTPQESYEFIDRMENGNPQPDAKQQNASDALRTMLDNKRDEIKALGKGHFASFNADYFPHIWERPGTFGAIFGKRPFEGSKAFLKARKYQTMSDGLKAGLKPASDNPVDLALLKMHEMDRYIMAHQTFNEFKGMGLIKFKREVGPMPIGYKAIDDRIVKRYIQPPFKGATTKVGEYVAPEHVANVFNNYLSPGLRNKAWFRGYLTVGNMMNQAQLGLSGFHIMNTGIDTSTGKLSIALKYLAEGKVGTAAKEGILGASQLGWIDNLIKGNAVLRAWRTGNGSPEILQIVDAMKAAGGRASMDSFYHTGMTEALTKQLNRGNYLGALLRLPGATAEMALKPVMEWWVPRLKLGSFMDMARFELAKLPAGASRQQLQERMGKAWDSVDNRMGEMVYDNLFWNKAAKDMAMASMRSVGWNLGTVRELLGGVKDTVQLGKKMVGVKSASKAEFTHRMAYLVAMPAMAGLLGGTIHYTLQKANGASDKDAIPEEWKDWFFPKTGEKDLDGNDVRLALPTYMKDVLSYAQNPVETVANKTHPLLNTVIQMLQNKDYYNTKIRNEDDPVYKQMGDLLAHFGKQFEPFSSREVRKLAEQGQTGGRQFLPLLGIVRARHDITDSPAVALAKQMVEKGMPSGARTSEEADKAKSKTDVIRKIRNKAPDADQSMDKLIDAGVVNDRGTARQMYNKAEHSTLWGLTQHLSISDAMKVMEAASSKERADLIDAMWKKLKDSKAITDEDRQKYADRLDQLEG